ncbi:hypothetical protein HHI36_019456 [Cryptolaemus montrouzieri]|uniref:Craniofacial development protein 2-like n=1 Tax=Cryptolaemus montrouzieri TaxID=559131 RepID=A0ABD2P3A0_9CUCU
MELEKYPVVVVAVYGPNDNASASEKDKFYNDWTRLLDCTSIRKEIFLMEDINGRTGSRADDPVIGRYGEVTNGWLQHKYIYRFTWTQLTRNQSEEYNRLYRCETGFRSQAIAVRAMREPDCGITFNFETLFPI